MSPLRIACLAALSLTLAAPASSQPRPLPPIAAQPVISLWSFGIGPQPIHLRAGQQVTLTFVNRSGGGHDFTARQFFAASTIVAGNAPGGEVELRGHETRTVTLIPRAGAYRAFCSHFFHKQMGMSDTIVVD